MLCELIGEWPRGRAPRSGRGGREFDPRLPDQEAIGFGFYAYFFVLVLAVPLIFKADSDPFVYLSLAFVSD